MPRLAELLAEAPAAARRLRGGWLRMIGAPDYAAYLAHHREHHAGTQPLSEREFVALFLEHRFNRGGGRCC